MWWIICMKSRYTVIKSGVLPAHLICITSLAYSIAKNNFQLTINTSVHNHGTRKANDLHIFNRLMNNSNVALEKAINEYNSIDIETRRLTYLRTLRARVRPKSLGKKCTWLRLLASYENSLPNLNQLKCP